MLFVRLIILRVKRVEGAKRKLSLVTNVHPKDTQELVFHVGRRLILKMNIPNLKLEDEVIMGTIALDQMMDKAREHLLNELLSSYDQIVLLTKLFAISPKPSLIKDLITYAGMCVETERVERLFEENPNFNKRKVN